jgi:hypothetical protein
VENPNSLLYVPVQLFLRIGASSTVLGESQYPRFAVSKNRSSSAFRPRFSDCVG